jgi:predicted nucleic acid-binding protein
VFAGALAALAAMITLGLLGLGIGLWSVEPGGEVDTLGGMTTATMIWSVISMLLSLLGGGYVAARMSASWEKQNSILHGLLVWSLATVALVWMTTSAVQSIFKSAVGAVGSISSGIASATKAITPDSLPDFSLPDVKMSDLPPELQQTLRDQGMTEENFMRETREAFRNVISKDEQAQMVDSTVNAIEDIIRTPGDAMSDLDSLGDELFGAGGVISEEDRNEAVAVMQRRTGVSEQEAEQMLERWETEARETFNEVKDSLQNAREKAMEAADTATDAAGKAALVAFVGLLLGAGAAAGGAALGRREHPYEDDDYADRRSFSA